MSLRIEPRVPLSSEKLRAVVLGTDLTVPRTAGFTLLRLSELEDKVPLMSGVLMNEQEPASFRRAAAQNLYVLNDEPSREVLLEAARAVRDQAAMVGVVKGLGRTGDERALRMIEQVSAEASEPLARQAKFAAALLSYRLDLPGHDLEPPRELLELPPEEGEPVRIAAPELEEARLCLDSLAAEPFGIQLGAESLQQLDCEHNRWMLLLNEEFTGDGALDRLRERKALLGVIASKSSESGSYSVIFTILTAASEERDKVRLSLTRTTGELGYSGEVSLSGRGPARFGLNSVAQPGIFGLRAEGTFDAAGRLEIASAVSALTIENKRNPTSLRVRRVG